MAMQDLYNGKHNVGEQRWNIIKYAIRPMHFVAFKEILLHYVLLLFGDAYASRGVAHHLIDHDGMNDFARHKMMIHSRYLMNNDNAWRGRS